MLKENELPLGAIRQLLPCLDLSCTLEYALAYVQLSSSLAVFFSFESIGARSLKASSEGFSSVPQSGEGCESGKSGGLIGVSASLSL